jgi:hypothetical protein
MSGNYSSYEAYVQTSLAVHAAQQERDAHALMVGASSKGGAYFSSGEGSHAVSGDPREWRTASSNKADQSQGGGGRGGVWPLSERELASMTDQEQLDAAVKRSADDDASDCTGNRYVPPHLRGSSEVAVKNSWYDDSDEEMSEANAIVRKAADQGLCQSGGESWEKQATNLDADAEAALSRKLPQLSLKTKNVWAALEEDVDSEEEGDDFIASSPSTAH